jgi:hypothetical protein
VLTALFAEGYERSCRLLHFPPLLQLN